MKTFLAIFLLLVTFPLYGQGAHRIGQVLVRGNGVAANVSPQASVLVCVAGTGCATSATVYSDIDLTQPLSQPVVADSSGNYDYYIAEGCVDEQISSPGQGSLILQNVCPFNGSGGATIAHTTNVIVGDGSGNGVASSIQATTSSTSHGVTFPASSAPITPISGNAIFTSDPSGNAAISENGVAASRPCTVGNGLCTGGPGTGTAQQMAFWSSTSALGSSVVYQQPSTNFIGINQTSPSKPLDVNGETLFGDHVSTNPNPSQDPYVTINRTMAGQTGTYFAHAITDDSTWNCTGCATSSAIASYDSRIAFAAGSVGLEHVVIFQGVPEITSGYTGTINRLLGGVFSGIINCTSCTVNSMANWEVDDYTTSSSFHATVNYGIHVTPLVNATTNWGLYVEANNIHVGGSIESTTNFILNRPSTSVGAYYNIETGGVADWVFGENSGSSDFVIGSSATSIDCVKSTNLCTFPLETTFGGPTSTSDPIVVLSTGSTGTADVNFMNSSGVESTAVGYANPGSSSFLGGNAFIFSAGNPLCLAPAIGLGQCAQMINADGSMTFNYPVHPTSNGAFIVTSANVADTAVTIANTSTGGGAWGISTSGSSPAGGLVTGDLVFSNIPSGGSPPATTISEWTATSAKFMVPLKLPVFVVSGLPSASSLPAGTQVIVSDATTFTPGTCTGSGSDYMIAVTNGTTWSCH